MAQLSSREVVDAYLRALAERDFEQVRSLLSDERFSTRSPIGDFADADSYVEDLSRVGPILERVERCKLFADGKDVCAVVNFVTRMERRYVSPVVYVMQVEGEKITSIETFFDATGYADLFETGKAQ